MIHVPVKNSAYLFFSHRYFLYSSKKMILVKFLFYIWCVASYVAPAKILAILPFQIKSHNEIFQKYVNGLHDCGHEMVVISSFPPQQQNLPNYTYIHSGVPDASESIVLGSGNTTGDLVHHFAFMYEWEKFHCHTILSQPAVRNLLMDGGDAFDLVILESYYVHCYLPIASVKDVPIIWYLAPSRMFAADLAIGNMQNPSYFPTTISRTYEFPATKSAPFFSRLMNFKNYLQLYFYHYFHFGPLTESICEEYFGGRVNCDVDDLFKRVSLVLTYSTTVLHPRPTVPNHVGIGGLHIKPAKPLSDDLQLFLDESERNIVYVSFGSMVSMDRAEKELIRSLLDAFSACDCEILWKSDLNIDANPDYRIPENVLLRRWFQQRDLLAHRKVKAFISHGGLFSTFEAMYTATPVIGVPLFFDQFDNVRRMAELDVGIHLSYEQVKTNSTHLKMALKEILNNPIYSKNMKKLSKIVQDVQQSPLDKAIYWTEYVIRHNGARHLRSVATDMPLYQYLLLDVIGVVLLFVIVITYLSIQIIRFGKSTIGRIFLSKKKKKTQ